MTASLLLAATAVLAMGFAIQRGGTCLVAAIEEVLIDRRGDRLLAIGEAGLWACGVIVLAHLGGALATLPANHAAGWRTVAGGLVFGLGAWINRACALGTVARLGSGEFTFALTPLGFLTGRWGGDLLGFGHPSAGPESLGSIAGDERLVAPFMALFLVWRVALLVRAMRRGQLGARVWSPHVATSVIGLAFAALLLTVGPWSYTEALADLARGMTSHALLRGALFVMLLAGALLGGLTAGRLHPARTPPAALFRRSAGGVLMGAGSLLLPGGNDALTLTAIPLLQLYGWVGGAAIMLAVLILRILRGRPTSAVTLLRAAPNWRP